MSQFQGNQKNRKRFHWKSKEGAIIAAVLLVLGTDTAIGVSRTFREDEVSRDIARRVRNSELCEAEAGAVSCIRAELEKPSDSPPSLHGSIELLSETSKTAMSRAGPENREAVQMESILEIAQFVNQRIRRSDRFSLSLAHITARKLERDIARKILRTLHGEWNNYPASRTVASGDTGLRNRAGTVLSELEMTLRNANSHGPFGNF